MLLTRYQSFLDDVRAHRIPVDFLELFDSSRVPFYDGISCGSVNIATRFTRFSFSLGCMVVELLDYRPKKAKDPPLEKPDRSRVTLHPNDETLWGDLCLINQRNDSKLTDIDVLELEARILVSSQDADLGNPHISCSYTQLLLFASTLILTSPA